MFLMAHEAEIEPAYAAAIDRMPVCHALLGNHESTIAHCRFRV